jgi:hypothetical protein
MGRAPRSEVMQLDPPMVVHEPLMTLLNARLPAWLREATERGVLWDLCKLRGGTTRPDRFGMPRFKRIASWDRPAAGVRQRLEDLVFGHGRALFISINY